jgi:hypothetical protein
LKRRLTVQFPFPNADRSRPVSSVENIAVKAVLLVFYLIGAICTAWGLTVPSVSGEQRSFLRVSFVIWPFTVAVFGVLVLLALLAHWYDRLALTLTGYRAVFQLSSPPLSRTTLETTPVVRGTKNGVSNEDVHPCARDHGASVSRTDHG